MRTFVKSGGGKFVESVCDGETKPTEKQEKPGCPQGKQYDFSEQITIVIEKKFR